MNTKITEKKFKDQARFYSLLEKTPGLQWLNVNYRSGEKVLQPVAEYKGLQVALLLCHTLVGVVMAFTIIGILSYISEIFSTPWDSGGKTLFSLVVFVGGFSCLTAFVFAIKALLNTMLTANWNMKLFKSDLELMMHHANISGAWIEWFSANGMETYSNNVPSHVVKTFGGWLMKKAKNVKSLEDPDRKKRHDDFTMLEVNKKECSELFELCKRFSIIPLDDEIRVLYSRAEQELRDEKTAKAKAGGGGPDSD